MGVDTWLTPYLDMWNEMQGVIAEGRLAKAVAASRTLLGQKDCVTAFRAFAASAPKLRPEWFGPNCRVWLKKGREASEPLVNDTGTLTDWGKRVYEGRA